MILKKNRVDKRTLEKVFKEGRFLTTPTLTLKYFIKDTTLPPRLSFIVSKSVSKLAVERNHLRRIGYAALKKYLDKFPNGLTGALIFRKKEENLLKLENEIEGLINRVR